MHRFLSLACLFTLLTGSSSTRLLAQPPVPKPELKANLKAESKATPKPTTLVELAKLYQMFELPLPPKESFFVITGSFTTPLIHLPANQELHYQFHFATGGPYPQENYRVWQGFQECAGRKMEVVFPRPPRPETVLRYLRMDPLEASFSQREGRGAGDLLFAIQCHLLQHFELAKFFYARSVHQIDEPLHHTLLGLAWNYWAEEYSNPKRTVAEVAQKLHFLVDKHGFLEALSAVEAKDEVRKIDQLKRHQELLDRIDSMMKESPALPGSIDALIDELVNDRLVWGKGTWWLGVSAPGEDAAKGQEMEKAPRKVRRDSSTETEVKLRNLGFAAIPFLIEHVDDERMIRQGMLPYLSSDLPPSSRVITLHSGDFLSVGSRVRYLLTAYFDLDEDKATKADYQTAWKDLKKMTENDFIDKKLKNVQELNAVTARLIYGKYKTKAIRAYETIVLQGINAGCFDMLLAAVADSDLDQATKIDLLARGARSGQVAHVQRILVELMQLNPGAFASACNAALEKLAWEGNGGDGDRARVAIVAMAFHTEDRKTRANAEKVVLGLPVNPRLAVLKGLTSAGPSSRDPANRGTNGAVKPETLRFLTQFLDDTLVYQDPEEEKTGFKNLDRSMSEMELRNFAAMQILKCMDIDMPFHALQYEYEWSKVRDFAKAEVDRRLENKSRQ